MRVFATKLLVWFLYTAVMELLLHQKRIEINKSHRGDASQNGTLFSRRKLKKKGLCVMARIKVSHSYFHKEAIFLNCAQKERHKILQLCNLQEKNSANHAHFYFIFFISSSLKELIYTHSCARKLLSEILILCNSELQCLKKHQNHLDQGKSSQTGRCWTADVLSESSD